jgi:hypothetical protein
MRLTSPPLSLGLSDGRLTSREWIVLVLGALALTVIVCLAEPNIFGSTDWVRMHGFYKAYIQESVSHGRLPLWNPHHWLGRPFLADIESAFFYPPEWLYLLLDIHIACILTITIHVFLCLYGTLKLARALGADKTISFFVAFVLAASVPMVGCFTSGLIHYGQTLCYTPLVFYLGMRLQGIHRTPRDVALLALFLGLAVLCGHPQAAWIIHVGLAVFLVGRRIGRPLRQSLAHFGIDLGLVAFATVLGAALAAVALLPLAELSGQSNRPSSSLAFAAVLAEPAYGWATLIVPIELPYFGFQANGQFYAGLIPLLAGLCGFFYVRDRNVRALLFVALFAALLAAGDRTPAFRLFYHVIPGLGWFRIHARASVLVTTAFVLAAGLFFSRPVSRRMAVWAGMLATLALAGSAAFALGWPGYGAAAVAMAVRRALFAVVAGALVVLWIFMGQLRQAWHGRALAACLVLATAIDLGWAVRALKQDNRETPPLAAEDHLQRALESLGLLKPGLAPPRVFIPTFRENAGMVRGWSGPHGYSALAPGRVWKYIHNVLSVPVPFEANTFPSRALAAFGPIPYDSMALVLGADPRTKRLAVNPKPDPRTYLASSALLVRNDDEATERIRAGHDFHNVALVERPLPLPSQALPFEGHTTITRFEAEHIAITVECSAPALLVLAEPWYPGWEARVNGTIAPCVPANAWMRAVLVPAGKSQVEMTFHSTFLVLGAVISLAALATIFVLLFRRRAAHLA